MWCAHLLLKLSTTVAIARALNFYAPNAAMQPTSDLESARVVTAEHRSFIDYYSNTVVVVVVDGWLVDDGPR